MGGSQHIGLDDDTINMWYNNQVPQNKVRKYPQEYQR